MPYPDTPARLRGLIDKYMGIDADKIADDASLLDDLGIDSLDKVELVMAAEDEFEIEITDDEAKEATTFNDVVELVDYHRARGG